MSGTWWPVPRPYPGGVNAKESDNIPRRVRRKQQELAEHGRPHGGPRRYGYRVDFSAIEPDEAAIIREMARRTLAGESLASLCRELNARGMPPAAGGRWSPATLRRILIGPHLASLRVYGEHLYPAAWPAILSEDIHHALRALLTDPQPKTTRRTPPGTSERVLDLRPLRHADVPLLPAGQDRPVKTLRCHSKLGGCGRLARGTEPIETFLEAALFEMVRRPAFAQFLTRRSAIPDERGKLLEQIRAVEALQQESLVAYAAPEPGARRRTKAEYELIAARLDDPAQPVQQENSSRQCTGAAWHLTNHDLQDEWAVLPFYARRRIVETLIAGVALLPVGQGGRQFDPSSVRIEWTF
jgi:site-specific DNA recombinase